MPPPQRNVFLEPPPHIFFLAADALVGAGMDPSLEVPYVGAYKDGTDYIYRGYTPPSRPASRPPFGAQAEVLQPGAWYPEESRSRRIRRLSRRNTVSPARVSAYESFPLEALSFSNGSGDSRPPSKPQDEQEAEHRQQFLSFVQEATRTLNKISEERQRRPWWERLIMYLRALWTDEPAISRRPSKLLFWHIDAENGEHLTTEPRSNGEYVVATREAATPERPERSFKAVMTMVRALARNKDPRQVRLNSPANQMKIPERKPNEQGTLNAGRNANRR